MKVIGYLLFLFVIGGLGFFILKNYLPDLIPPSKNIKQYLPLSSNTPSPLKISEGLRMDLFYDLKGELPTKMFFDDDVLFSVISNTGKIVAFPQNKKVYVVKGLNKPQGLAIHKGFLYVIERYSVSRYLFDSSSFSVSSKEELIDFSKTTKFQPTELSINNDTIYMTDGVQFYTSNIDGANLVQSDSSDRTRFYEFDNSDNYIEVVDNRVVKFKTFAGSTNGQLDLLYGMTQENGDMLGNLSDLVLDKAGNIYVSDSKNGLIYTISK